MRVRFALSLVLLSLLATGCSPAEREPRFDSRIDPNSTPLPTAQPGPVVASLAERILAFDVSPDGSMIAMGTSKRVLLYDFKARTLLRQLAIGELASRVTWSPDGRKLAIGSSKDYGRPFYVGGDSSNSWKAHLTVWDASTWQVLFEPEFGMEMVNGMFQSLAWSPDGRELAYSTDVSGVRVLDTLTGQVISEQKDFASTVTSVSWSPDGARLVAVGDTAYGIRRWRVADNIAVRLFDRRAGNSMDVEWSPDGKRIASAHNMGGVCLWTAATNQCDGFIQAHRTAAFSLAWSPDGDKLATGGGVIRIWDVQTGKLLDAFGEDSGYMYEEIEWPAQAGPLVSLESGLDDPGMTMLRVWDLARRSITAEWRGNQPGG